jgi:hypothetical protein
MTKRPDISITVLVSEGRLTLQLNSLKGGSLCVPLGVSEKKLSELRRTFSTGLEEFVRIIAREGVAKDPSLAAAAIRQLYNTGAEIGFALFKTDVNHLSTFLSQACPQWRLAGSSAYVPAWFQMVCPLDLPLPLEFLPLFDTREPEIRGAADVFETAARFPAFSTVFSRQSPHQDFALAEEVIENWPALIVRLFRHSGLTGAEKEESHLRRAPGTRLRDPWPNRSLTPDEFITRLASQLYAGLSPDDSFHPQQPDHIQHFVCHCDTARPDSRYYSLTLAHRESLAFIPRIVNRSATLGQLQRKFFALATSATRRAATRPLVFFNACGTSKVTSEGVSSFPGLFLDLHNRGVIGTEVAVPDLAAAEFAQLFYGHFLSGLPLGDAIYHARITLLHTHYNPVGVLYSTYGNPDLRLRNPAVGLRA